MKKKIFIKALACTLCLTMLAGCSSKKTVSKENVKTEEETEYEVDIQTNDDNDDMITQLKAKYENETDVEYTEPMYNLEKNHIFTFEDVSEDVFDNDEYDCFKVFYDSAMEKNVDVTVEFDWDNNAVLVYPNLVFSYEDPEGSIVDDGTWGTRSKFWLVQYVDLETGEMFDKPKVTVFTIKQDLNTPTLVQTVDENGNYTLKWSEVEGADYYEVYEYYDGTDFASLEVTTKETTCNYNDFATAISRKESFEETYGDTEIDTSTVWSINTMLDPIYGHFVVAKTDDGKCSGMSNECMVEDIANLIPKRVSDDFKTEYEGDSVLALPAYIDMEMIDGSTGQFLISYKGAQVTLLDDGRIFIEPSIRNLPVEMQIIEFSGMDFDTFMAEADKLKEREDELAKKSGTTTQNIDVPYVPDNDYENSDDEDSDDNTTNPETTEVETSTEKKEEETTTKDDGSTTSKGNDGNELDISEEVLETVYGNTALSEWIALNLLAHEENISLAEFPESSDSEYLVDAIMEAYTQNPLCGIMSDLRYDYSKDILKVSYVLTEEETKEMQEKSLEKAAEIANEIIREGMSDYEKEEAINKYICENAKYNESIFDYINADGTVADEAVSDYVHSFTPYGVLVENVGVCESYAEAFLLISNAAGLEAVIETGRMDGVNHEWNRVKIDGQWYSMDVTNNDCDFLPNCYFNLSDDIAGSILQEDGDAFIDEYISNYSANGMDNEYYNKNGLYMENDDEAVSKLVEILAEDDVAAVRVDFNYNASEAQKIAQKVVNEASISSAKYYYNAGVISVVKQ